MADEESPVPQSPISEEEVAALLEKKDGKDAAGVKPYDFTLNRINRTQLPMLEVVNKTFAARAGLSLSALLGRDASVHFESIE
jgi:flagellar motor switch protein FliM